MGDPYDWSTQDVLDFFTNEAAAYILDLRGGRLPDLPHFLQVLQDNEITGAHLINAVDAPFLQHECGIKVLAVRSTIIHCIKKLKERSSFLRRRDGTLAPQTTAPVISRQPTTSAETPVTQPPVVGENVRTGEVEVRDGNGRKRRKLNLVQPQSQPQEESVAQPQPPRETPPNVGFLSDVGLPIDGVFYGNTAMGQVIGELAPDGELFVDDTDIQPFTKPQRKTPLEEGDFYHYAAQNKPVGEVSYVYTQLRHFFQNDNSRVIKRGGQDATAIFPYREELQTDKKAVSATVFQRRGSDAVAIRENAAYLDGDVDYAGLPSEAIGGEWDFLVSRHKQDGEQDLPAYARSDTESITSSLEREMQRDQAEDDEDNRQYLTADEAEAVIEQCIDEIVAKWKEKKLPRLEKSARVVWRRMKQSRTMREALINGAKLTVQRLSDRLSKQKSEMLREQWRSEKDLRQLCETMELTVQHREEEDWKMSVWQRRQEPSHTANHNCSQRPSTQKTPSNHTHKPGFVVHPNDRFSVSPTPMVADAHEQDEAQNGGESGAEVLGDAGDAGDDEISVDEDPPGGEFVKNDSPSALDSPIRSTGSWSPRDGEVQAPTAVSDTRNDSSSTTETDSPALAEMSTFVDLSTPPKKKPDVVWISSDSTNSSSGGNRKKKVSVAKSNIDYQADPLLATAAQVQDWDEDTLIKQSDRLRLLIILLTECGPKERKRMQSRVTELQKKAFVEQMLQTLRAIRQNNSHTGQDASEKILTTCARMFLSHQYLDLQHSRSPETSKKVNWTQIISDTNQANMFYDQLCSILRKLDSKLFIKREEASPSSGVASKKSKLSESSPHFAGSISSDRDSDAEPIDETPSKKRSKRKPKLNDAAAQSQHQAFHRQDRFRAVQAQAASPQKLAAIIHKDASRSEIQINLLKEDDQDPIFVDQKIARAMKEHQIAGVQFMWREITAVGDDEGQGCLLAHTMGLGKTMQAITILVALDEAAQSNNPRVYEQLPPQLRIPTEEDRQLRMLILCPPKLIANWRNEIKKWAPKKLKQVYAIESADKKSFHDSEMKQWSIFGGVLLIGYDLFRSKLKANKSEADDNENYLLNCPEVVVADEAHKMKNVKSELSKTAKRIKTESRIALSGTPMSNDVDEVYALISWVAPNYLGAQKEFNAQYATPIREGNRTDSIPGQVRKAIKRLAVLHLKIEPKVSRADHEVLKGSLRKKVEFLIELPLTSIQHSVYSAYVEALGGKLKPSEKTSQVTIFGWLQVLTLLTTHPVAFKRRLLAPPRKTRRKEPDPTPGQSDDPITPELLDEEDETVNAVGTLGFTEKQRQDLTADIADNVDPNLSAKVTMLMTILGLSEQCGDKVLVFSHYLASLDYLEELFKARQIRAKRIDGQVNSATRELIINDCQSGKADVMLISTRAGGEGMNLQFANRVIIMDSNFNPSHEEQAVGRAYRLGQPKPVYVYRFVMGGTFEANIYSTQLFKMSMTKKVIDKKKTKRAGAKSTDYLYLPREVLQMDITPEIGKDEAVLDKIILKQTENADEPSTDIAAIRSIHTLETLQADGNDAPLTEEERREVEEEYIMDQSMRLRERRTGIPSYRDSMVPPLSTAPVDGRNRVGMPRTPNINSLPNFVGSVSNWPSETPPPPQDGLLVRPRVPGAVNAPLESLPDMPNGLPRVPSTAPGRP